MRMRVATRPFLWIGLALVGILFGPAFYSLVISPPAKGYFKFKSTACACGHARFLLLQNGSLVSYIPKHNHKFEIYRVTALDHGYAIESPDGEIEGTIHFTPWSLIFSHHEHGTDQVPRALNLWRIWFDQLTSDGS